MTGFEPQTSGIDSDCSTNWATTTAQVIEFVWSRIFGCVPRLCFMRLVTSREWPLQHNTALGTIISVVDLLNDRVCVG